MAADTPADAVLKTSRVSACRLTGMRAGMNGFRSISGCFFAIGAGPKIGEGDGETKRERDSKMDGMQTELDAKIAQAEARIANILLMEMIEALEARGHIKRSDMLCQAQRSAMSSAAILPARFSVWSGARN